MEEIVTATLPISKSLFEDIIHFASFCSARTKDDRRESFVLTVKAQMLPLVEIRNSCLSLYEEDHFEVETYMSAYTYKMTHDTEIRGVTYLHRISRTIYFVYVSALGAKLGGDITLCSFKWYVWYYGYRINTRKDCKVVLIKTIEDRIVPMEDDDFTLLGINNIGDPFAKVEPVHAPTPTPIIKEPFSLIMCIQWSPFVDFDWLSACDIQDMISKCIRTHTIRRETGDSSPPDVIVYVLARINGGVYGGGVGGDVGGDVGGHELPTEVSARAFKKYISSLMLNVDNLVSYAVLKLVNGVLTQMECKDNFVIPYESKFIWAKDTDPYKPI